MKKNFKIYLLIICLLWFESIYASNKNDMKNYSNDYGVILSEKEYDFISKMFYEGYQEIINEEEIKKMRLSKVIKDEVQKIEIPLISEQSLNSGGRILNLTKSCGTTCLIAMNISWNNIPKVKEYDVLGFRVTDIEIKDTNTTKVSANNYSKAYPYNKSSKEGRGFSIVLPNASNIKVSASIYTSKNGKVYGTYQHAKEETDLNTSKLYNFNSSGSGKVMLFYGKAFGKYDDINGLNVNV